MSDQYVEKPVMMKTTAPNQLLRNCVLLVERESAPGTHFPHGTAFLVGMGSLQYAVTARHVVQERSVDGWGALYGGLTLRAQSASVAAGAPTSFRKTLHSRWFDSSNMFLFHPDATVDAAIFATYRTREPERSIALPVDMLQSDELVLPGEDVHLFGFPAMYGTQDGTPVIRGGTIAYKINRYEYLLDITSWNGDSGGLVCSKPYFGVPADDLTRYQWQVGGKVIGVLQRYDPPRLHGLPQELENFRVITSAQAVREIIATPAFQALHAHLQALAEQQSAAVV